MIEIFCRKICIADGKDVLNGFYVFGVGWCPVFVSNPKNVCFRLCPNIYLEAI